MATWRHTIQGLVLMLGMLPTASGQGTNQQKRSEQGGRSTVDGNRVDRQSRDLQREIDALQERLMGLQARYLQIQVEGAYTLARAREWQRLQFFDIRSQQSTLTFYNAPTFLWTPQVLEQRYNAEWRRFATLNAEAVRVSYEAMCIATQLREKRRQLCQAIQDWPPVEGRYHGSVPRP